MLTVSSPSHFKRRSDAVAPFFSHDWPNGISKPSSTLRRRSLPPVAKASERKAAPTPSPPMATQARGLTMCASHLRLVEKLVVQAGKLAEQAHHVVDHHQQ